MVRQRGIWIRLARSPFIRGDKVKSIARDADMYYHLHVMKYFRPMEVVDVKEFNGRPWYHLKGVNNWGQVNEHFYDKANGLLLGEAFNTAWRGGKDDSTTTFEEYKDFGGILGPAESTSRDGDDLSINLITATTMQMMPCSLLRNRSERLRPQRRPADHRSRQDQSRLCEPRRGGPMLTRYVSFWYGVIPCVVGFLFDVTGYIRYLGAFADRSHSRF